MNYLQKEKKKKKKKKKKEKKEKMAHACRAWDDAFVSRGDGPLVASLCFKSPIEHVLRCFMTEICMHITSNRRNCHLVALEVV
ncbi:hypothetical protein HJC23_000133 [Cyclotella cryptica]|uniref:Uncharacterized protein n=1 Tax=Cyclotella cryptica TaxID=29204 RepID=A0ABD3PKK0_9STRA